MSENTIEPYVKPGHTGNYTAADADTTAAIATFKGVELMGTALAPLLPQDAVNNWGDDVEKITALPTHEVRLTEFYEEMDRGTDTVTLSDNFGAMLELRRGSLTELSRMATGLVNAIYSRSIEQASGFITDSNGKFDEGYQTARYTATTNIARSREEVSSQLGEMQRLQDQLTRARQDITQLIPEYEATYAKVIMNAETLDMAQNSLAEQKNVFAQCARYINHKVPQAPEDLDQTMGQQAVPQESFVQGSYIDEIERRYATIPDPTQRENAIKLAVVQAHSTAQSEAARYKEMIEECNRKKIELDVEEAPQRVAIGNIIEAHENTAPLADKALIEACAAQLAAIHDGTASQPHVNYSGDVQLESYLVNGTNREEFLSIEAVIKWARMAVDVYGMRSVVLVNEQVNLSDANSQEVDQISENLFSLTHEISETLFGGQLEVARAIEDRAYFANRQADKVRRSIGGSWQEVLDSQNQFVTKLLDYKIASANENVSGQALGRKMDDLRSLQGQFKDRQDEWRKKSATIRELNMRLASINTPGNSSGRFTRAEADTTSAPDTDNPHAIIGRLATLRELIETDEGEIDRIDELISVLQPQVDAESESVAELTASRQAKEQKLLDFMLSKAEIGMPEIRRMKNGIVQAVQAESAAQGAAKQTMSEYAQRELERRELAAARQSAEEQAAREPAVPEVPSDTLVPVRRSIKERFSFIKKRR